MPKSRSWNTRKAKSLSVGKGNSGGASNQRPSSSLSPAPTTGLNDENLSDAPISPKTQSHKESITVSSEHTHSSQGVEGNIPGDLEEELRRAEEKANEVPGNEPARQPQSTPISPTAHPVTSTERDKEAEQTATSLTAGPATRRRGNEEGLQPATQSQASSFDPLPKSPMRVDESEAHKEITQTQEPSSVASNAPEQAATDQSQSGRSDRSRPDVSGSNIKARPPPLSLGSEQQDDPSSSMSTQTKQPPVFIMGDADASRFAPFMGEGPRDPNESETDIRIRDQIRRCEAVLGRPLTEEHKDVIRSYYRDMERGRGPSQASEPTAARSPTYWEGYEDAQESAGPSGNNGGGTAPDREQTPSPVPGPSASHPSIDSGNVPLGDEKDTGKSEYDRQKPKLDDDPREEIEILEAALRKAEEQRDAREKERDAALASFTLIRLQREDFDKKVAALEKELKEVKAGLAELKGRLDRADADKEGKRLADRLARLPGPFGIKTVLFTMVVLAWLTSEAVLHSKRLSDGYGEFINGGFNGLRSVLIFGTWAKFLLYEIAFGFLMYLMLVGF